MTKVISIWSHGHNWHVPLSAVADHRAKYYAERDEDTTYQVEFDFVMEDDFEGLDWFQNNMDFSDVAGVAKLVCTPKPRIEPDMSDYEMDIVTVPA